MGMKLSGRKDGGKAGRLGNKGERIYRNNEIRFETAVDVLVFSISQCATERLRTVHMSYQGKASRWLKSDLCFLSFYNLIKFVC
jgi:hypothetical protein